MGSLFAIAALFFFFLLRLLGIQSLRLRLPVGCCEPLEIVVCFVGMLQECLAGIFLFRVPQSALLLEHMLREERAACGTQLAASAHLHACTRQKPVKKGLGVRFRKGS